MRNTTVKIDEKIWATLRELSKEDGRQMKWHADRALANYLKSKKRGGV